MLANTNRCTKKSRKTNRKTIKAFSEGKTIQKRCLIGNKKSQWVDVSHPLSLDYECGESSL
ncbi:MAG: hypothetical protein ACOC22_03440 [bacterium]